MPTMSMLFLALSTGPMLLVHSVLCRRTGGIVDLIIPRRTCWTHLRCVHHRGYPQQGRFLITRIQPTMNLSSVFKLPAFRQD